MSAPAAPAAPVLVWLPLAAAPRVWHATHRLPGSWTGVLAVCGAGALSPTAVPADAAPSGRWVAPCDRCSAYAALPGA